MQFRIRRRHLSAFNAWLDQPFSGKLPAAWTIDFPACEITPRFDRRALEWTALDGRVLRIEFHPLARIFADGTEVVRQVKTHVAGYYDEWDGFLSLRGNYGKTSSIRFVDSSQKLVMLSKRRCGEIANGWVVFKRSYQERVHILAGIVLTAEIQETYRPMRSLIQFT